MKNIQHGSVSLLVLIVSVALLVLVATLWYTSPADVTTDQTNSIQPKKSDGTVPENKMEQYQADIDAAKNVQDLIQTKDIQLAE